MNNLNISNDNLGKLLEVAGKKFGKDPNELKQQLESGNLDSVLGGLDPKAASQVQALLKNPAALELLLKNPGMQKMLTGLMNKG